MLRMQKLFTPTLPKPANKSSCNHWNSARKQCFVNGWVFVDRGLAPKVIKPPIGVAGSFYTPSPYYQTGSMATRAIFVTKKLASLSFLKCKFQVELGYFVGLVHLHTIVS